VQPVDAPHPGVGELGVRKQIDQAGVVPLRGDLDGLVDEVDPRPHKTGGGQPLGHVGEPEDQDVGSGRADPLDRAVVALGQRLRVEVATQHVVAAGREADQVGPHRDGQRHLLVDDVVEQPAADGQVGVAEVVGPGEPREVIRDQVGPAPVGAAVRIGVVHSLGEAVAHRHEAAPPSHDPHPFRRTAAGESEFAQRHSGGWLAFERTGNTAPWPCRPCKTS
jgi:hypothetical protein